MIKDKLGSRKFWFALVGALMPILMQAMTGEVGWMEAMALALTVIVAYIFGQGYVDGKAAEGVPQGTVEAIEASISERPTASVRDGR